MSQNAKQRVMVSPSSSTMHSCSLEKIMVYPHPSSKIIFPPSPGRWVSIKARMDIW